MAGRAPRLSSDRAMSLDRHAAMEDTAIMALLRQGDDRHECPWLGDLRTAECHLLNHAR
jgi:hypothetical protein